MRFRRKTTDPDAAPEAKPEAETAKTAAGAEAGKDDATDKGKDKTTDKGDAAKGQPTGERTAASIRAASGARPTTGSHPVVVPVEERLEGQRAWIAQIERKLAIRTYAGAAAIVLALAAGIVGTVLALSAKDESATKTEVQALSDRLSNSQKETANAAEEDLSSVADRLDALESRVDTVTADQRTTDSELKVVQDDIDELRTDVSNIDVTPPASSGTGSGTGANGDASR
jgi:hypothetical protein